jgi:quercetin dioxygenase-like cupin family protein
MTMRLATILLALMFGLGPARAETRIVPVERTPFHVPTFRNGSVAMLNVVLPAHREAPYHRHALDFAFVLVRSSPFLIQNWGDPAPSAMSWPRGFVGYGAFLAKPLVHRAENIGDAPLHFVGFELLEPAPSGHTPSERPAAYEQIIDNDRLRGWRLRLQPGQSVPAFPQSAPGVRIVVEGGALVETDAAGDVQDMALTAGDFQWRDAGTARALRNDGGETIDLVEFELK